MKKQQILLLFVILDVTFTYSVSTVKDKWAFLWIMKAGGCDWLHFPAAKFDSFCICDVVVALGPWVHVYLYGFISKPYKKLAGLPHRIDICAILVNVDDFHKIFEWP